MRHSFIVFILAVLTLTMGPACGSDGSPFEMESQTTMVVGDAGSGNMSLLVNPEEETQTGTLTAQINQEFFNRRTLVVEDFNIELTFPTIGTVLMVLNPNLESTATVYRLDANNQPFGTHTMTLNLLVETADQTLQYDNVMLASDTATLTLTQLLPILGFTFQGDPKELQILGLQVVIPASLITSDIDPL